MSKPTHLQDTRSGHNQPRVFFITTQTAGRRSLFQTERMANLLIDVLRTNAAAGRFRVHDFVVMPNHLHALITVPGDLKIEKAAQLIKGGFSFRARRELGFRGEIWQQGFSDVLVSDRSSFLEHRQYIEQNPIRAGLVSDPAEFPFCSLYFKRRKSATGAEALVLG